MQENKQEKSPIKKRILQYLDYKGISQYEFYKNTGITRGILTQNNGISEENISRLLVVFGEISPNWLITGDGNMLKSSSNIIPKQPPEMSQMVQETSVQYGCKLCKEKDDRIVDLKDTINNLKEMNASYQGIINTQQSVIHSLQTHIEDLQQLHFDSDEAAPPRTG